MENENLSGWRKVAFRRTYVINPRFQFTMIGYVTLLSAVIIGSLYGLEVFFIQRFERLGASVGLPVHHIYFEFINGQKQFLNRAVFVLSAAVFVILSVAGIFISHRIAGPIHRFCQHLKSMEQDGTLREVRFRKKDFFPELSESFNRFIQTLRGGGQSGPKP